MRATRSWDPTAYAVFGDERTRPFRDLLAQVRADGPRLVADLGCGNGPATLLLADRWEGARIVGVDSSASMLAAARDADPPGRVEWVEADLRQWDPTSLGAPADVIVSNATLQWIPSHLPLLDRWVQALRPGGWLALQVPGNFDAPSHALMRATAAAHPRADELTEALEHPSAPEASTYLRYLMRLGCAVDAWETTYLHVLPAGEEHPVLTWVRATGLRPVLDLLEGEELTAFTDDYAASLADAYPVTTEGVVFPFRRTFVVARRAA